MKDFPLDEMTEEKSRQPLDLSPNNTGGHSPRTDFSSSQKCNCLVWLFTIKQRSREGRDRAIANVFFTSAFTFLDRTGLIRHSSVGTMYLYLLDTAPVNLDTCKLT